MSILYEKSLSEKYRRYFTSQAELSAKLAKYSITRQSFIEDAIKLEPWEHSMAGIPLVWNEKSNTVAVDHTDSHTLVIGPTGSKKTRLFVMPLIRILANEKESMVITDPKAELYERTAIYLEEKGYSISVINLRSPQYGDAWNPLSIPYKFYCNNQVDKAYEFANDIAENLLNIDKSHNEPFWDNSAASFFFGLILLLFKFCREKGLNENYVTIDNLIRLKSALLMHLDGRIGLNLLWKYAQKDPIITNALIGTIETAKDTRGGILSSFEQKMRLFSIQPNLTKMLSSNTVQFDSLGEKPTAIYLILPDEKTGYHRLVSLFIKQSYEYMVHSAQGKEECSKGIRGGVLSNRVNYILDEFSSLPSITDFPAMITAARSRNIRFNIIIQSKHQVINKYKDEADVILSNCNNWIFLTSKELKLLEEVSSLCGMVDYSSRSPVISVSLLQKLDKESGEALVISGRNKPCIVKLPDIKVYDNERYDSRDPGEIPNVDVAPLSFELENMVNTSKMEDEA